MEAELRDFASTPLPRASNHVEAGTFDTSNEWESRRHRAAALLGHRWHLSLDYLTASGDSMNTLSSRTALL